MSDSQSGLDRATIEIVDAAPLMRRASYASVSVAILLILVKFVAGLFTGSIAILSSLVDSVLDLVASVINLIAINQAVQPADRQYRFGHGKAEAIGSLTQGAIVLGSAAFIGFEAATMLIEPHPLENTSAGIAVMVFSILTTFGLVAYQRSVVRRTHSTAVSADSLHYSGDLAMNVSVIVALLIVKFTGFTYADPLFAIGIAAYLAWNAWQILQTSVHMLMDRELSDQDRTKIKDMVTAHPDVRGVHDMRTRSAGATVFIQFHIDLPPEVSLKQAHTVSDAIEESLLERYPGAEIIIHADPQGVDETRDDFKR